jgi:hypothetical protein
MRHPQPLVPHPIGSFSLISEFQAISKVGKEAMSVIRGNLKETFYAVDVGMNCQ